MIASGKLQGDYFTPDAEDAVEKIYQSGGSLNATEASCYKSDCYVRAKINTLADETPSQCTFYVDLSSANGPFSIESLE
jgi:hypothetical protein